MSPAVLLALVYAGGLLGTARSSPTTSMVDDAGALSCPTSTEETQRQKEGLRHLEKDHSLFQLDHSMSSALASLRSRQAELDSGDEVQGAIVEDTVGHSPPAEAAIGWNPSPAIKGAGQWCEVGIPQTLDLSKCPAVGSTTLKVLTYNLFWWNLFGQRNGNGQSAGRKIAQTSGLEGYDLMGFQECDSVSRVLGDAHNQGLSGDYELFDAGRALAIAWRKSSFAWLAEGKADVGEDHPDQYYGKRSAQWVRLRHSDGQTVFFVNHHGPLPVSWGGGCTGSATAFNILKLIATHARASDVVILVGDFNAEAHSSRIQALDGYMRRVFSGTKMNGVDHIFSNCPAASAANLGTGGSDHDALSVTFSI